MSELVICPSCAEPVKADDLGGIFTVVGMKGTFVVHKNKKCLDRFMLLRERYNNRIESRPERNWNYKCGHGSNGIILDDNELSILAYLDWKDTVGIDGDMSKCFECYCSFNNGKVKV